MEQQSLQNNSIYSYNKDISQINSNQLKVDL
jgi:hypothetical protein